MRLIGIVIALVGFVILCWTSFLLWRGRLIDFEITRGIEEVEEYVHERG